MNTPKKIRTLASAADFGVDELRLIEKEPYYGLASRALFIPFMGYERLVNGSDRLAGLRGQILAVLRVQHERTEHVAGGSPGVELIG